MNVLTLGMRLRRLEEAKSAIRHGKDFTVLEKAARWAGLLALAHRGTTDNPRTARLRELFTIADGRRKEAET